MSGNRGLSGSCSDKFKPLQEAFEQSFLDGMEVGASLAVTLRGEPVLDLWGGAFDQNREHAWQRDTLTVVSSSTKLITALCTLVAVDRGLLDLDQPVARYWPDFSQHGKEHITVRDAMTHRALVPGFRQPHPYEVRYDWDRFVALIAAERPWFDPGTFCYHALVYGHILGELIRRVTGVPFQSFFNEVIRDALDADFHMGIDESEFHRVSPSIQTVGLPFVEGSIQKAVFDSLEALPANYLEDAERRRKFRSSVWPAAGGYGNARSMARILSFVACGGELEGRRFLSKDIIKEATTRQVHANCPVVGDIVFGLGFGLDGPGFKMPTPDCCGWGGYGGSWLLIDPVNEVSMAYAMNLLLMDNDFSDEVWTHEGPLSRRQYAIWDVYADVAKTL